MKPVKVEDSVDMSQHAVPDWRIARSADESTKLLAQRPTCPKDWLILWHTRSRVMPRPQDGGCCKRLDEGDVPLIYDPCDADVRLGSGVDPHARSSLAARALEAVSGRRVLIVGDSVSTQWAAAQSASDRPTASTTLTRRPRGAAEQPRSLPFAYCTRFASLLV